MRRVAMGVFVAAVLAVCAGCGTGVTTVPGRSAGEAAVSDGSTPTWDKCRGGTYNRAAGLCVGGGGP